MTDQARFLRYIDRSRDFYAAQGYDQPYRWASHTDAPFTKPARPIAESRIGLITTALRSDGDPLAPYAAPATPPPTEMATKHLHWHQTATHTADLGTFLPLRHLNSLVEEGSVGAASPRYYGIPTIYSQRRTMKWAAELVEWLREDAVDIAVFSPL